MKTLLDKIFTITLGAAFLCNTSVECQVANPQSKIKDYKLKNSLLLHMKQNQSLKNSNKKFGIKIKPFWEDINAPHTYNSFIQQIEIPSFNAIWAQVNYDSVPYDPNQFLRSADGGKTWRLDSVDAPNGYGLSGISPVDANTCYAALYNAFVGIGGGIFKTTDGGDTWKQVNPGKLFSENSFPDLVYFFDAQHGVTVGDDDGTDTSRLEIYTTSNAGNTWQRVPKQNIPPTAGYAFSSNFNSYTVFQNRFWFTAGDSYGNNYTYRSDDFGGHWQQFPLSATFNDFAFADKQNGLGVSFDYGVGPHEVETHDGGKTWAGKSFAGYPMGLFITTIPSTHTFISTIPYGVAPVAGSSYSNDFGATWKLIDSSSGFSAFAVAFLNPLIGWAGRANSPDPNGGMYKWKYNFSLGNSDVTANNNPTSLSLTKNDISNSITARLYPNPSKDVITIKDLNPMLKTTLSLFSSSGKLIQQLSTSGNESYQINIQKLAAGSYYVRIQSGEKITTLKFVKE